MVSKFANDSRIIGWDLYNEPGQKGIASHNISKERTIELYRKIGLEITEDNYSNYDLNRIDPKDKKQVYTLSLLKKQLNGLEKLILLNQLRLGYMNGM